MNTLEVFKRSSAWDSRYDLPLVPQHSNPWIYGAYAWKIISLDEKVTDNELIELQRSFRKFFSACRLTSGLINKWPDGSGGMTSHDEIIGASKINRDNAREIALYLTMTDGVYINKPKEIPQGAEETANVFRILWVRPVLMTLAEFRVGLFLQAQYALVLLLDALTYKEGDEGSRLRFWLTLNNMEDNWLSGFAARFWKKKMTEKGLSPKKCFEKYLSEVPVFREYAPDSF